MRHGLHINKQKSYFDGRRDGRQTNGSEEHARTNAHDTERGTEERRRWREGSTRAKADGQMLCVWQYCAKELS